MMANKTLFIFFILGCFKSKQDFVIYRNKTLKYTNGLYAVYLQQIKKSYQSFYRGKKTSNTLLT
jgi:hypothetical protein